MQNYDISGKQFGCWTVLSRDYSYNSKHHTKWFCKCRCGTVRSVSRSTLVSGRSKSCGCFSLNKKGRKKTHGMSRTRIYKIWSCMRRRCKSKHDRTYKTYVLRGITVCDEWEHSFESFLDWSLKNGYTDSLTIDRINNDLGYFPDNCRWIPLNEQSSNKSNCIYIMYNNEKWCLYSLCKSIGYPYSRAYMHYRYLKDNGIDITPDNIFTKAYKPRH